LLALHTSQWPAAAFWDSIAHVDPLGTMVWPKYLALLWFSANHVSFFCPYVIPCRAPFSLTQKQMAGATRWFRVNPEGFSQTRRSATSEKDGQSVSPCLHHSKVSAGDQAIILAERCSVTSLKMCLLCDHSKVSFAIQSEALAARWGGD
jgi:hypothetical protein